jgi:hypothetical protein
MTILFGAGFSSPWGPVLPGLWPLLLEGDAETEGEPEALFEFWNLTDWEGLDAARGTPDVGWGNGVSASAKGELVACFLDLRLLERVDLVDLGGLVLLPL